MRKYSQVKEQLRYITEKFNGFKIIFQRDFELIIAEIESRRVAAAEADAERVAQQEQHQQDVPDQDIPCSGSVQNEHISRLYRKLCKKCHPDVCGSDADFLKIQESFESGDNIGLIEIAVQHDISIDEYIENMDEMKGYWLHEIEKIEQEMYDITHMLPWVWCTADTDRKNELRPVMIQYIRNSG